MLYSIAKLTIHGLKFQCKDVFHFLCQINMKIFLHRRVHPLFVVNFFTQVTERLITLIDCSPWTISKTSWIQNDH